RPGDSIKVSVYFRVHRRPSDDFRLQVVARPPPGDDGAGDRQATSKLRFTKDFPTSRWREGEIVRDRFQIRIPESWPAGAATRVAVGLRVAQARSPRFLRPAAGAAADDPELAILGTVLVRGS